MNIIYLHCHDAGRLLSPYGFAVDTPHLQAFSEESVLFRQAHCAAPTCSPSRAALLTGQTAHESGMLGLAHRGFSLRHPDRLLARLLRREHGMQAYLAGIQHVFNFREKGITDSYDRMLASHNPGTSMNDPERDRLVAEAAVTFLNERNKEDTPFLLECGFFFPHRTFPDTDPDINPDQLQPPPKHPDQPAIREDMAGFQTAVRNMDSAFGMVWNALQQGGWTDNSLIFFTTDHGIPYPFHKCQLHDTGTGVALLMRPPGPARASQVCDALVSHLDVYPTLCDYLCIPVPEWCQGSSMRPLIEGQTTSIRKELHAEVTFHAGYEPKRCVRTNHYAYIRNYELAFHPALANVDGGLAKSWMIDQGLLPYPVAAEELYDLHADPGERRNLAGLSECEHLLEEMRERLDRWMRDTQDPLLLGPVPAPQGTTITPPDSIHP